jgi:hypothetical protein
MAYGYELDMAAQPTGAAASPLSLGIGDAAGLGQPGAGAPGGAPPPMQAGVNAPQGTLRNQMQVNRGGAMGSPNFSGPRLLAGAQLAALGLGGLGPGAGRAGLGMLAARAGRPTFGQQIGQLLLPYGYGPMVRNFGMSMLGANDRPGQQGAAGFISNPWGTAQQRMNPLLEQILQRFR